ACHAERPGIARRRRSRLGRARGRGRWRRRGRSMMRALITNDDGIDAPGLAVLAKAAAAQGLEVTVAAPERQSSGTSASIVAGEEGGRIAVERRHIEGLEDIPTFAVRGGPGLIALIAAHGAFGDPADVVLSGVNHGANVG